MHLTNPISDIFPSVPSPCPKLSTYRLKVSPHELKAAITAAGPRESLSTIIIEHAITTMRLAAVGVQYLCQGEAARQAYQRMTITEFMRINARQAWANWRTISLNLHGQLPIDRPLTVIDLCCGMGDSTGVLATKNSFINS